MNSDQKQNSSGDRHVHVQDGAGARSARPRGKVGLPRMESAGLSTCLGYTQDTPRCATASHPFTPSVCTTAAEVSTELISI